MKKVRGLDKSNKSGESKKNNGSRGIEILRFYFPRRLLVYRVGQNYFLIDWLLP